MAKTGGGSPSAALFRSPASCIVATMVGRVRQAIDCQRKFRPPTRTPLPTAGCGTWARPQASRAPPAGARGRLLLVCTGPTWPDLASCPTLGTAKALLEDPLAPASRMH